MKSLAYSVPEVRVELIRGNAGFGGVPDRCRGLVRYESRIGLKSPDEGHGFIDAELAAADREQGTPFDVEGTADRGSCRSRRAGATAWRPAPAPGRRMSRSELAGSRCKPGAPLPSRG